MRRGRSKVGGEASAVKPTGCWGPPGCIVRPRDARVTQRTGPKAAPAVAGSPLPAPRAAARARAVAWGMGDHHVDPPGMRFENEQSCFHPLGIKGGMLGTCGHSLDAS